MRTLAKVEAMALLTRSSATTNNPTFFVIARDTSGVDHEVVVKPRLDDGRFCCEWLGAALASELGLTVPPSFAVHTSTAFVGSLAPVDADFFTGGATIYGAGSVKDTGGPSRPLPAKLKDAAAKMLVFDLLVQNADRRITNANFFQNATEFVLFDHEFIGSELPLILPKPVESLVPEHWCRPELAGVAFGNYSTWLLTLTDTAIDAALAIGTAHWPFSSGQKFAENIKQRRDTAPEWLRRIQP